MKKEEVLKSCYDWYIETQKVLPENATLASTVWVQKYCLTDGNGNYLEKTPEDMWQRIANALTEVEIKTNKKNNRSREEWYKLFYNNLKNFKAVPGGSALAVLGNDYINSSVSNCFVVGLEDSLEGIMKTASEMARIQSYRGGTGLDISCLRPAGSFVNNSAKNSTGAVSFMDFFSKVTATIGQTGRCLKEDQRVLTARGLIKIKDVLPQDMIWTQIGWIKNINTVYNGNKSVYKLISKRGLEITATENHIFTIFKDGKIIECQLKELTTGDKIITIPGTVIDLPYVSLNTIVSYTKGHESNNCGNRLNENIIYPDKLTEDLAYFIGYSFGDGYVARDKWNNPESLSLACAHSQPEIQEKLITTCTNSFNYSMKVHKGDGQVNKVSMHSKLVCLFLEINGLLKQKHDALVLPESIMSSSTSVQMAFISGYFDADGYASGSKKGYVIASVCEPILKSMQKMLLASGIVSHISKESRKQETIKDLFSLSITGAVSQKLALSLLSESIKIKHKGFISRKDSHLTPFSSESLGIKSYKYKYIQDNHHILSANAYSQLQLKESLTNILIQDEIISIEPAGSAEVYDLQLASHHLFYCEGFNVHNSGATMLTIDSHHPDVESFIEEKQDLDKQSFFNDLKEVGIDINDWKYTAISARLKSTTKANVSVKAYDEFMNAVDKDLDYELHYEFKDNKYPKISKIIRARDLWDKLIKANLSSAEPGILFFDTVLRESVSDCYAGKQISPIIIDGELTEIEHDFRTVSHNPCGELPLSVGGACTLLSQNLTQYINNPWTKSAKFDFDSFSSDIRISTRMLDNIKEYDIPKLPLLINKVDAILGRRLGLGCHGLADALAALGLKYDSEEAIQMAGLIYNKLANTVYDESVTLGIEKGNFPLWNWELEKNNPFLNRLNSEVLKRIEKYGRRNIACLTNAPTGSISILSRNCSSGIEPVFKCEYTRSVKKQGSEETTQHIIHHQAVEDCIEAGANTEVFIEANDIKWEYRIRMQSIIQLMIDHSISSTINLPEDTTEKTISDIYLTAWKSGLKGVTTYVEGCRTGVLNAIVKTKQTTERPKMTNINIHKVKYKDNNWAVLVGFTSIGPIEVFAGIENDTPLPNKYHKAELVKKSRGHYSLTVWLSEDEEDVIKINNIGARFPAAEGMTLTRFISLSLRNGIPVSEICEQLQKSSSSLFDYPAVLGRVLKNYIPEEELNLTLKPCPECGSNIKFKRESGCIVEYCESCSYVNSKCG